jgi:putative peptidoglycan lipid II flippase
VGRTAVNLRAAVQGVAGAAAMIAVITALSRLLGLARWLVQAHTVGVLTIGESYTAANTVPNVLFEAAAGGALAGAVIPLLAGPIGARASHRVQQIVSATLGWTVVVLVPLGVLLVVFADPVARLLSQHSGSVELTSFFLRVFAVQIPFYGVTVLAYAVLQAHKRFFWPAFAPILSSLVTIGAYLWYGRLAGRELSDPTVLAPHALDVLAWGTTAGVVAMCVPALLAMRGLGIRLRPAVRFPSGAGGRFRTLAVAGVAAVAAQQLSVAVMVVLAGAGRADGTWPVYQYAQQVYLLPYAILVVPLATSVFPRLSAATAGGDRDRFAGLAATSTRAVLVVASAGAAAVVAMAPAIALVFGSLQREQADVVVPAMTTALTLMVPGLLGFAVMFHASRTLYALERGRAVLVVNAIGWGTVTVAAVALFAVVGRDGAVIAALSGASGLGMTVGGAAALVVLAREAGARSLTGLRRTLPVLLVGAAAAAVGGRWVADSVLMLIGPGVWPALVAASGGGVLALVVVLGALGLADRDALATFWRAERGRPGPIPPRA